MSKQWIDCDWDDCPECGGDAEAYTDSDLDGALYDGDVIRCVSCGYKGGASICEDTAYIHWLDFEDQPKIVRDMIALKDNGGAP